MNKEINKGISVQHLKEGMQPGRTGDRIPKQRAAEPPEGWQHGVRVGWFHP